MAQHHPPIVQLHPLQRCQRLATVPGLLEALRQTQALCWLPGLACLSLPTLPQSPA